MNTLLRSDKKERRRVRSGLLASGLVLVCLGYLVFAIAQPLVAYASEIPPLQHTIQQIPALVFFTAFWLLVLSALTVSIQTFFLNQELPLLLASPASPRAIFTAKLIDTTIANGAFFVAVGGPAMLALSLAQGAFSAQYLVCLVLVMAAFAALPTTIGVLLTFILMRVLPASRTRDLLTAVGISLFAGFYLLVNMMARRVDDQQMVHGDIERIANVTGKSLFRHGPWAWAGDALGGGLPTHLVFCNVALLVGMAVVAVALTAVMANWMHWRGWVTAQEIGVARKGRKAAYRSWEAYLPWLAGPVRAVLIKDLRTLGRDMRQCSMMLTLVVVIAVFLLNVAQSGTTEHVPAVLLMQTLLIMLGPASLRIAMSAYIAESRAVWLIICAPNHPSTLLWGKYLYAYVLTAPIALASGAVYGALTHMSVAQDALMVVLMLCAMGGLNGIGIGLGAVFADFSADNIRFVIPGVGRMLILGIQLIYTVSFCACTVGSWLLVERVGLAPSLSYGGAVFVVALLTGGAIAGSLALGVRRLSRQMEM